MISNLTTSDLQSTAGPGDLVVAILIIILILLAIYKMCRVWQNILNYKQVTPVWGGYHRREMENLNRKIFLCFPLLPFLPLWNHLC